MVSDFLSTIRDGRHYQSQKARLGRCGLSRAFYLVEGPVESWSHKNELKRMLEELASITVDASLLLFRTSSIEESLRFLATAAARLEGHLSERSPRQLRDERAIRTYAEFRAATLPPRPIGAAFGQMLLNVHGDSHTRSCLPHASPQLSLTCLTPVSRPMCILTPGLTASMVERLLERWAAPAELMAALESHESVWGSGSKEAGWLFAEVLEPGNMKYKLSERLTDFFWKFDYKEHGAGAAGR